MKKKSLTAVAVAGALAFGAVNFTAPTPAHAACLDDAMMTKEMAMKVTDAAVKDKALQHVAMADEKAKAGMEADCMEEVMKAKATIDGKEMMDDKMDKKTSG
ncbi:MAG: hypothetical protein ACTSWM_04620 [Alphaproteobacteria bacterium]